MTTRTPHLDAHYEAELNDLMLHLVKTGSRAEGMVRDAVHALVHRDVALARNIVTMDQDLDNMEVETDRICVALLARRAPVGQDLRFVTSALKVVIDMERVGDLAVNIAKRSVDIATQPGIEPIPEISELGEGVAKLVNRAVRALQQRDAAAASTIAAEDKRIDDLNRRVFERMIAMAKDHSDQLERALAYTSVSRHLERVGDHAVNIAEMVVYFVEGKVMRHGWAQRQKVASQG